jgi:hypothetical protein
MSDARVSIRRGAVYLPAELCARYFSGLDAVIVMIRDRRLMVLPVMQMTAGGTLLKIRNARGDRVALAPDLFDANGLGDFAAEGLPVRWSTEDAALIVALPEN